MRVSQLNAVPLAMATTFGLLLLMTSLINTEFEVLPLAPSTEPISVIMPEMKVTTIPPRAPEKPLPAQTPPKIVEPLEMNTAREPVFIGAPGPAPGPEPVVIDGLVEGHFMPLVQVAPEYPRAASSRGIEGFVTVEFTVTSTGSTRNVIVIEAIKKDGSPTSVFDRAAIQAAEKFK